MQQIYFLLQSTCKTSPASANTCDTLDTGKGCGRNVYAVTIFSDVIYNN